MKIPRHIPKNNPDWQAERASILHRACVSIAAAIQRGDPVGRAIRRTARRNNGRPYKSDPSRRLHLSSVTMRREWDKWIRAGRSPDAFKLNFTSRPSITAPVLIRFAKFCASGRRKSLCAAWREFSARPGVFGRGCRKNTRRISYDVLRCYFQASDFYLFQHHLKVAREAQASLADRLRIVAEGIHNSAHNGAEGRPAKNRAQALSTRQRP